MKNLIIGVSAGLITAVIISIIGFNFADTNLILLGLMALGVIAFLPLILKAFTSSKVPTPTVYGTSAPKKHTTIDKSQASGKEKESKAVSLNKAMIMAGAGAGVLIVFFASAIIYLQ